jgi:serine/threonine-protein kinase
VESVGLELRDALLGTAIEGAAGVRYHLRELLGEGGQGWVYKANYDDPDGFWVVVKVLRPEGLVPETLKRFEREAEVLRMLGSVPAPNPNIVRFYDYGSHPVSSLDGEVGLPFITLEYVEGQTLSRVIQAHGGFGLPVARVRRLMKQVARALHSVHEQRIVHRDLKPSNILLTQLQGQEVAKVTDFGLVKLPQLAAHRTATVAGASLGYAPPEQYEMGNNRVTVQTDVFSFAAILYEVLCGTEAFPYKMGDNPLRIVARMLSGERPALVRVSATVPRELRDRPDLTAALDRELARAMSPDPAVRQASVRELWQNVEPILRDAIKRGSGPHTFEDPLSFENSGPITSAGPSDPPSSSLRPDWRMIGRPMTGEQLRASVIAPDGRTIIAVGAHGLYRFARGVWSAMHLPAGVDARFVRGVSRLPTGELLMYGDAAFAMTVAPSGAVERMDLRDRDMTILHAHVDGQGIVFAGERLSRPIGAIAEVSSAGAIHLRSIDGTVRLHAICRAASGSLIACGTHGALVEMTRSGSREVPWGRTGHLYAIAPALEGGAFAVGSGGHALKISQPPSLPGIVAAPVATLEAVQTTRDLTRVVVDVTGCPWAVGAQGRLLQRREGVWTRIPLDALAQGTLIDVAPHEGGITVLSEDGLVLEGRGVP